MPFQWLMRLALWARNPPGPRKVKVVAIVLLICLAVVGLEALGLLPDWMSEERNWTRRNWRF